MGRGDCSKSYLLKPSSWQPWAHQDLTRGTAPGARYSMLQPSAQWGIPGGACQAHLGSAWHMPHSRTPEPCKSLIPCTPCPAPAWPRALLGIPASAAALPASRGKADLSIWKVAGVFCHFSGVRTYKIYIYQHQQIFFHQYFLFNFSFI